MCLDYCVGLGAAYMATQYGYECWCSADSGLDYNRHYDVVGEDAVCDMNCWGDEVRTLCTAWHGILMQRGDASM